MFDAKLSLVLTASMMVFGTTFVACGDGSEGGGSGGEGTGKVGEPCTSTCDLGLVCSSGTFNGLCTVQCGSDSACQQFALEARCYGTGVAECALMCEQNEDCPTGTTCKEAFGGSAPKACMR